MLTIHPPFKPIIALFTIAGLQPYIIRPCAKMSDFVTCKKARQSQPKEVFPILHIILTICRPIHFSIKLDTSKSGWPILIYWGVTCYNCQNYIVFLSLKIDFVFAKGSILSSQKDRFLIFATLLTLTLQLVISLVSKGSQPIPCYARSWYIGIYASLLIISMTK